MRKPLLLLALVVTFPVFGGDLTPFAGTWEGHFDYSGEPLELRMKVDPGRSPAVTIDYPQLVFANQPAESAVEEGSLVVTLPLGLGEAAFRRVPGGLRAARTTGSGVPIVISLAPAPELKTTTQDLSFGADPQIEGTLTLPDGPGPFPLAILLAGSGNPTRTNLSYTSWSDLLARIGVASFAYDRRLDDTLNAEGRRYSIPEHAADLSAAIDQLSRHPRIDTDAVGLIAKSRGGWISLATAASDPGVAFIVGIGIAAVDIPEQDLQALEARMRASEANEEEIQAALAYMRLYFHVAAHPEDFSRLKAASEQASAASWGERVRHPETVSDLDWFKAQLDFDPLSLISKIDAPMFLAWGADDRTTPPSMNLPLFRDLMSAAVASGSVIRVYEGAGHTLEGPLNVDDDPDIEWEGMNQDFLRDVKDWLLTNFGKGR